MLYFKKFNEIIFKYKTTFKIANIKKTILCSYIFNFLTVGLDAIGISILLPIGEYILQYDKGSCS